MNNLKPPARVDMEAAWWLVLALVGLDYFSTLAYLPSLAVQAVGPLAPLAAAFIVVVTLGLALPVYLYVVGRSPHGRGATGLIERLIKGWKGKLAVLLLLAFVATDYVVTQNLSVADAAEHVRGNPLFRRHVDPWLDANWHPEGWFDHPLWQRLVALFNRQLAVTLVLSGATLASWAAWRRAGTRVFLRVAVVVVAVYLAFLTIVVGSSVLYLAGEGRALFDEWRPAALGEMRGDSAAAGIVGAWRLTRLAAVSFPYFALGMSGFELSMAVAPLVAGRAGDDPQAPQGRIANMRKLLVVAALVMSALLVTAVSSVAMLVPMNALVDTGRASHRALAYLAHGGTLIDGHSSSHINRLFGPWFGTLFDLSTISILCLAGACVAIVLRDYVPEYLQRFGMELDWAHRVGIKMQFFNIVVLTVTLLFRAQIAALQWVYATSMLVLLSGASIAAFVDLRERRPRAWWRPLALVPAAAGVAFFGEMTFLTVAISRSGLEIALAFGLGILVTSMLSRWIRSTELRFSGFAFADDESKHRWEECCAHPFQIIVPHRPGLHARDVKVQSIRKRHRLGDEVPVIVVEAQLGDPSDFMQAPLMRIRHEADIELIEVSRCVSVAHVLAAVSLAMTRVGRPPELHFGWSDESPLAANLHFLLFGEGNIPWMVRALIAKAEPNPERRPRVIVG